MAVLDSTFLIAIERREATSFELLDQLRSQAEPCRVPAACWLEFVSSYPAARQAAAGRALDEMTLFAEFGRREVEVAARLQAQLRDAGRKLSWHDVQVAATAIALDELLVTNDRRFEEVPNLRTLGH